MNESTDAEQPEYLETWSLRCHPFEAGVDARFFYAGSALMQRLDLLTHLVQFGESIVVVSGPPGSGKSTLLEQFLGHINPQWSVCLLDGADSANLAARLAETVGGDAAQGEQALLAHWAAHSDSSQHLVLVIDNAEQIDESGCRRLCELVDSADAERVRIVLFGTAEAQQRVRETLEQLGSKRSSQMLEIPRLTEEETSAYLMYRLAVAGYSGESPFTPTEVRAICKAADGRPGAINRLAHEALAEHHNRARNKQRAPIQPGAGTGGRAKTWIAAALGVAAIAAYLGWGRLAPAPDAEPGTPARVAVTEVPLPLPETPLPVEDSPPDTATADASGETPVPTVAAVGEATTEPPPPADAPAPETARGPAADTGDTPPAPAPQASAAETTARVETPAPDASATSEAPARESASEPAPQPPAAPPAPTIAAADSPAPPTPDASPEPAAAPPTQKPEATPPATGPHREDWLLTQPPASFTLQLLGSRDEASIRAFIREHRLDPAHTAWYRGRYKGADWYVLLYGVYPDKAAALAARATLPARVRKGKPWPRSLKSVQNSIREARQP